MALNSMTELGAIFYPYIISFFLISYQEKV